MEGTVHKAFENQGLILFEVGHNGIIWPQKVVNVANQSYIFSAFSQRAVSQHNTGFAFWSCNFSLLILTSPGCQRVCQMFEEVDEALSHNIVKFCPCPKRGMWEKQ